MQRPSAVQREKLGSVADGQHGESTPQRRIQEPPIELELGLGYDLERDVVRVGARGREVVAARNQESADRVDRERRISLRRQVDRRRSNLCQRPRIGGVQVVVATPLPPAPALVEPHR